MTLGDVLYTDSNTPQETERAWVALVRAVAKGDAPSLHSLYERSHRLVYTLCLRITGSPGAAEELTLQVFYDVWSSASKYRAADGPVLGWIMSQARSRALERARKDGRAKDATSERTRRHEEQGRLLEEALEGLTTPERQAIESTYFSELTQADAAARLKMQPAVFRNWIRSGLAKLREAMATNT